MVHDYSDYSEILSLILTMFFFEFISTFQWNIIYFFILKTSLFIHIVLFKSDDIFKDMIQSVFNPSSFSTFYVHFRVVFRIIFHNLEFPYFVKLELNLVHTRKKYPNAAFPHSKFIQKFQKTQILSQMHSLST